jgi:hypothetical protein
MELTWSTEWPREQWLRVRKHQQQLPCSHSSCLKVAAKDAKNMYVIIETILYYSI